MANSGFGDGENDDVLDETREVKFFWARVNDNADPKCIGRVKCWIPGVTRKETTWAFPVGMPGAGYAEMGSFIIPRVGSMVLVGFALGDFDEPFYFAGSPYLGADGQGLAPSIIQKQTATDAPNVRVIQQTESFEVYISDTATEQKIVIATLDGSTVIELDAKDGSISLKAERGIKLDAPAVQIDGLNVSVKNRPVSPLGLSI